MKMYQLKPTDLFLAQDKPCKVCGKAQAFSAYPICWHCYWKGYRLMKRVQLELGI